MATGMISRRAIPRLLIMFRFLAGPAILALVWLFGLDARYICAALLALGVLSDIFDGVIARRLGCATATLRKLDSRADVVFWLFTLLAALKACPGARPSLLTMAGVLVLIELVAPVISFIRFRQEASTHHILSKVFGLGLWLLMTVLLLHGSAGWLQPAVFALGVVSQIEGIAIVLALPAWRTDISGIGHALRLRRQAQREVSFTRSTP